MISNNSFCSSTVLRSKAAHAKVRGSFRLGVYLNPTFIRGLAFIEQLQFLSFLIALFLVSIILYVYYRFMALYGKNTSKKGIICRQFCL